MVRELGFMQATLAATDYPPSSVHTIVELGNRDSLTAVELVALLGLEKSSVSRMVRKLIEAGEIEEVPNEQDARSKKLQLTEQGRQTLRAVDAFAIERVSAAMTHLTRTQQQTVSDGLGHYAAALRTQRLGAPPPDTPLQIARGYRPGIIGRMVEMHATYYARHANFGQPFESLVASDMAELMGRLHNPRNEVWVALDGERIVGSIAIDGEGEDAVLRCFILDDSARGKGAGKRLLAEAIRFCDEWGFRATKLWTFKGLDAARKLYEDVGFTLAREEEGEHWGGRITGQWFVRPGAGNPPGS
ncbi:bifunctional helix-turn-helix transcriptional regulator/GNAT family N-acetyltransferase [Pseudomonas frederiksbergensis]|uniref:MarR family transcriptional regulator n=1 Tax=Pseudomonas frederiksbergensis TaxID=104087 RepID=A0A423KRN0_9PSED|nr:helix-turn-helix domain-containing GNAT family N-acetyltransferase [Pseudomonas frederiksbergensis]RON58003.1 MarR family transcriptional regulator [Pseudomonas frederiksbergensis]